jgi:lysophospholipase L1-like esterase
VVFFGASITEAWDLKQAFPGKPYVNRGVGGEFVAAMTERFDRDVVAAKPRAVVMKICAINFLKKAPPIDETRRAFAAMIDRAVAAKVTPVLATIVPVTKAWADKQGEQMQPGILALNEWLRGIARDKGYPLVDYHARMAGADGYAPEAIMADGLHPNAQGYALMKATAGPVVEAAYARQLATSGH